MSVQPQLQLDDSAWVVVVDGNATAAALFDRHYSRNPKSRGDLRIAGPGEKIVLLTPCARALLVWRVFRSKDPTAGPGDINCAIFRNEGAGLSSTLIRQAMEIAFARWGSRRFYTYVNPRRVRSTNPGCCFKRAGWTVCGQTITRRLLILEFAGDAMQAERAAYVKRWESAPQWADWRLETDIGVVWEMHKPRQLGCDERCEPRPLAEGER